MALKPDRHINPYGTEINFVFNGTADAGTIMAYGVSGSGAAVADEVSGTVVVGAANPTGVAVAGLLLHPFVTYNALLHRNWYKVTQYPGDKATLLRQGWVTTNVITPGGTPTAGAPAYLGPNGTVTALAPVTAGDAPTVGQFMSRINEEGYVRLLVDIP